MSPIFAYNYFPKWIACFAFSPLDWMNSYLCEDMKVSEGRAGTGNIALQAVDFLDWDLRSGAGQCSYTYSSFCSYYSVDRFDPGQ